MKTSHFKIVRVVDGFMEYMNYIGPQNKIPHGWYYAFKLVKVTKRKTG
jgi:hypothetical protein